MRRSGFDFAVKPPKESARSDMTATGRKLKSTGRVRMNIHKKLLIIQNRKSLNESTKY